ncbi:MAG: hypothetical protein IPF60_04155 [Betaproteobacteria bacterium]|nr:hypothetical protein [Betaproteobacteria bacterium]
MNPSRSLRWLSSLIIPLVTVAAHAVTLSPASRSLLPGDKSTITVSRVRGAVTLANSNPSAVSASLTRGAINVSADAVGVATLSVTDSQGTKTATVTVSPPLGVSLANVSLLVGRSTALTVSNAIARSGSVNPAAPPSAATLSGTWSR